MHSIRVELHRATADIYELLHQRLAQQHIHRMIKDDQGRWWKLPPAEYCSYSPETNEAIRQQVFNVVQNVWPDAEIFVVGVNGWASSGLIAA